MLYLSILNLWCRLYKCKYSVFLSVVYCGVTASYYGCVPVLAGKVDGQADRSHLKSGYNTHEDVKVDSLAKTASKSRTMQATFLSKQDGG